LNRALETISTISKSYASRKITVPWRHSPFPLGLFIRSLFCGSQLNDFSVSKVPSLLLPKVSSPPSTSSPIPSATLYAMAVPYRALAGRMRTVCAGVPTPISKVDQTPSLPSLSHSQKSPSFAPRRRHIP
jgi:hypothetical protein